MVKHKSMIMLVPRHRTVFAGIGLVLAKALLYSAAEIVQQRAAPTAANSPIMMHFPSYTPAEGYAKSC
ncbi:MAG: hypothetical protein N3F10_03580 [Candidatus Bathyarchaeota archaeon]|nr:hypothetical protein [Candidatus Bathyarchaeota archaeon]